MAAAVRPAAHPGTAGNQFASLLSECRELPDYFAEDMIIKAPSPNIMNKLARSVLALYSYDDNPDDLSTKNVLRQSIELIAMLPTIMGICLSGQAPAL